MGMEGGGGQKCWNLLSKKASKGGGWGSEKMDGP